MKDILSLKDVEKIKADPMYKTDKDYLYNYVLQCEQEYDEELKIKDRIKKYNKFEQTVNSQSEENEKIISTPVTKPTKSDSKMLDITEFYNKVIEAEELDDLLVSLPKDTNSINTIINLVLLKITQEINEAQELLYSSNDEDIKEEMLNYINMLQEKFEMLIDYRDYEEDIEYKEENNDKPTYLLFVPNQNGKINFMTDIDDNINDDKYQAILNGLKRLKDNTMKVYRRIVNHGITVGIGEIYISAQCRIYIDKYSTSNANYIFIIGAIQKKYDNSKYFQSYLENRILDYRYYRQELLPLLQSEQEFDIIAQQEEIYNLVTNSLETGEKYARTIK